MNAAGQTAPASQPTAAPNAPVSNPASDEHHALLGRAVKSIVHGVMGNDVSYASDPATGQVREITSPAGPGSFFRRLVAGMLVAGAAGAGQKTFAGGFGAGAQASAAQQQNADQQRYARAQLQIKDQQEKSRIDDDGLMHKAQIAHLNAQVASWQHDQHAADQETIEHHNTSARAYEQQLQSSGGSLGKDFYRWKTRRYVFGQ